MDEHPLYDDKTIERFWSKVHKRRGRNACWIWTAGTRNGYGNLSVHGEKIDAHRFAWQLEHGEEVPEGLMVRHLCEGPKLCVRPGHLGLGNLKANALDEVMRRRGLCGKGLHRITRRDGRLTRNAYVWKGQIRCGACRVAYRARRKAARSG